MDSKQISIYLVSEMRKLKVTQISPLMLSAIYYLSAQTWKGVTG